jgi:hypothetical protein
VSDKGLAAFFNWDTIRIPKAIIVDSSGREVWTGAAVIRKGGGLELDPPLPDDAKPIEGHLTAAVDIQADGEEWTIRCD